LSYNMLALWNDMPQLYILISGEKHRWKKFYYKTKNTIQTTLVIF
jgi:hypothetical protein